ncbi:MAG: bifunctional glutamate N-acetyltransferase/amino-acid acetyltransferase ArgJ [Oscillospiraceae bacterium]
MNNANIQPVNGGVCAPKGFSAGGVHCGIAKKADKKDLALIFSEQPCTAAATYTTNKVQAAPIRTTMAHLADGTARAILCNSGNANACNADGDRVAAQMCQLAAKALGILAEDVVVASTGVIGVPLPIGPIEGGIESLVKALDATEKGSDDCAAAIMTTDTAKKEIAVTVEIGDKTVTIGGICKGSGMIHPNMATMLAFVTTDAAISAGMLQKALSAVVKDTFNMVSVDGDTSTNDMCTVLANGMAGNAEITGTGEDFAAFTAGLRAVCLYMAKAIAKDGEGATKLLECAVTGAKDETSARVLAKSVITSSLFKAAMFGADANWGRVLCAMGYADADFDPLKVSVSFASAAGVIQVCKDGGSLSFSEERAKEILTQNEIEILIALADGEGKAVEGHSAVAWGCDLTYDYVKINGDYRS